MKKDITKITADRILSWIFGVAFILNGSYRLIDALNSSPFNYIFLLKGTWYLCGGLVLFPPLADYFEKKYREGLSFGAKALIIIIIFLLEVIF